MNQDLHIPNWRNLSAAEMRQIANIMSCAADKREEEEAGLIHCVNCADLNCQPKAIKYGMDIIYTKGTRMVDMYEGLKHFYPTPNQYDEVIPWLKRVLKYQESIKKTWSHSCDFMGKVCWLCYAKKNDINAKVEDVVEVCDNGGWFKYSNLCTRCHGLTFYRNPKFNFSDKYISRLMDWQCNHCEKWYFNDNYKNNMSGAKINGTVIEDYHEIWCDKCAQENY